MIISEYKKLNYLYKVEDTFSAGLVLYGDEVKFIKTNKIDLSDSYVKINSDNEVLIRNLKLGLYKKSNINTIKHKLNRNIKILLNKKEIIKLKSFLDQKKFTCVPAKIFLKNNLLKVEIAIVSGKKKFDKREDLKKRDVKRQVQKKYKLSL